MPSYPVRPILILVMAMIGGAISGLFFSAVPVLQAQSTSPLTIQPDTGRIGVGTMTPNDKLDVAGTLRILSGSNPVRFTSGWTGFPDAVTNQAEISNDTITYKTLMIVGNRSAGPVRRVSVWDRLEVNGTFTTTGNVGVGTIVPAQKVDVAGNMNVSGAYYRGGVAGFTGVVSGGTCSGVSLDIRGGIIVAAVSWDNCPVPSGG